MYGRINISQVIFTVIFVTLFVSVSTFFMIRQGTIVINLPYKTEYLISEANLDRCVESKTPQCPEVKCKDTPSSIVLLVFAIIVYAGSLLIMVLRNNKCGKREEEIKEREEQVTKDEANLYKKLHPTKKRKR